MDGLVQNVLLVIFLLCTFCNVSDSKNLGRKTFIGHSNRTLARFRRQAQDQSCNGGKSKFQCATTTDCIDIDLGCDGKEDCPDGSDEKESLCKNFPKKCLTPNQPTNGQWIYINNGKKGPANVRTDTNTVITFSCDAGYKLSTVNELTLSVLCLASGEWSVTVETTCQKLCPSIRSPLIILSCKNDGSLVPCDKATDNTILTYECAPYYEPFNIQHKKSTCYDGSWDHTPECIPVCGEKRVSATPLVVGGVEVERGNYPWVVALYSNKHTDPDFTNICGGSLITTDMVLTAAHCVSKKETGELYPVKFFRVGAGKYYNYYMDEGDSDTAQYSEVAKIEVPGEYRGEYQNFRGDIALLKLKTTFALSKFVQPVCYNNLPELKVNSIGVVTGWGYTTSSGQPSDVLKELELPYNEESKCKSEFDPDFAKKYFTPDKLCAGFTDKNTSICKGDAGGGLVFRNPHFQNRYFIYGIVSLVPSFTFNQEVHCNIQRSVLFTKVETYIDWIWLKVRQGIQDYFNNSDEDEKKYSTTTTTPATPEVGKKCLTPEQPTNGQWIYLNDGKRGPANVRIDANTVITFSCDAGYKLSTTNDRTLLVACMSSGEWGVTVKPTCQKLCPSINNSPLITLSCKNDGSVVPCDKATDNTILTYNCASYYEPLYGLPKQSTCYDGSWDHTPKCIPVCGEKRVSATSLIVGGIEAERGNYPWVVALYSNRDSDPDFKNICGGSLITIDIVLTAAHCVWKEQTGASYPAKFFRVGAGKYYNYYMDKRDNDTAQYSEVAKIEVPGEYRGELQNFRGDIALLKLKTTFSLSKVVQPVCYYNLPDLEINSIGLVTGWGYTTSAGQPSEVLKELELPYNEESKCESELDPDFAKKYLISDKLCAGFTDKNTSVCKGDSGGGLVFRNPRYQNRYFIHGIVSLAQSFILNQEKHCNIQRSALFTKVETYIEWIQLKVRRWTSNNMQP